MNLFSNFEKINYAGFNSTNLLNRVATIKSNLSKFDVYYDYLIHDGERADTIAHDYYGNSDYAWLVYICNDIHDPYYQWPLTERQFHKYLYKKYGQVQQLKNVISHYQYRGIGGNTDDEIGRIGYQMSIDTYNNSDPQVTNGWLPVYLYDVEYQLNEDKRKIKLLSNIYLSQVDNEIIELFR